MLQNNKLPKNWRVVKLKDITTLSSQKHSPIKPENLFYIGLEHIEKHTGKLTQKAGIDKITTIKNKFSKGDILYGKLRPNLNKVYLSKEDGVCSTDILVLKLSKECLGKYLHAIMFGNTFVNIMSENTSGVNLPRVSTKIVMNYEIPLPPLETQNLIVSKIEELFSELDKGIEDLKKAQEQLKIYRQSVLKWAFEGKLTNKKVKEGELPKGWKLTKISEVVTFSSLKHQPIKQEELFYIGLEHIEKHTGKLTSKVGIEKITTLKNKFSKGNILYGKLRPNLNKVYLSNEEGVCSTDILVLKLSDNCLGEYLHHTMLSTNFVNEMSENTSGVNLPRVSTKFIMNYEIPLPTIKEQYQIIQEIESRLSVSDKMEESIAQSLHLAEALRQSILKKAFSGELV